MNDSILAALRHCRDVLATNGFETDAVTLNNAIRELKHDTALGNAYDRGIDYGIAHGRLNEREACAAKAREYAGHYPHSSVCRNTFILLAEWIEARGKAP